MILPGVASFAAFVALSMMSMAIALAVVRLIRGPSLPDRVVALDLISILAAGVIAVYTIETGEAAYLDVAIALALVGFLGTVAFARYIEKQVSHE